MFDVGFWELVILFGLGLLVLGPERMPRVANQLGRWVGQARNMARHLTSQIRDEIEPFESGFRSAEQNLRKDFSAKRPEPGQSTAASDTKSGATKSASAESTDAESAEAKTADTKTAESKSADSGSSDTKSAHAKPATTASAGAAETADTGADKQA